MMAVGTELLPTTGMRMSGQLFFCAVASGTWPLRSAFTAGVPEEWGARSLADKWQTERTDPGRPGPPALPFHRDEQVRECEGDPFSKAPNPAKKGPFHGPQDSHRPLLVPHPPPLPKPRVHTRTALAERAGDTELTAGSCPPEHLPPRVKGVL